MNALSTRTLGAMSTTMDSVRAALAEQHAELWDVVGSLDEERWQVPSRCDGWSVADVVLHLCQTDEMAAGSLRGHFGEAALDLADAFSVEVEAAPDSRSGTVARGVDDAAAQAVARQRGAPGAEVAARWRRASSDVVAAAEAVEPRARVAWVAGELSATTLVTTRLAETWIHTGDVAEPLGIVLAPGDRLRHVARLAWRTLPYAFAQAGEAAPGPVAFRLRGPTGEPWDLEPDGAGAGAGAGGDGSAVTVVEGDGVELCLLAARRVEPGETGLRATGPDAEAVLRLVRTYA